jgi:broad specificity phosphatase PhoE
LQQWVRELIYIIVGLFWLLCCRNPKDYRNGRGGKRVCFIRHGQGQHNTSMLAWTMVDPPLNGTGEEQVKTLHSTLRETLPTFDLVAVSPLTRAVQTALGVFDGSSVPFYVLPLLRERLGAPCDRGRPKHALLEALPQLAGWDGIEDLPEVWWSTRWVELDLYSRVESLERWIHSRPEATIALVGHGGLFMRLLGKHLKNCGHEWEDWGTAGAGPGGGAERLRAAAREVALKQRAVSRFVVWGGA